MTTFPLIRWAVKLGDSCNSQILCLKLLPTWHIWIDVNWIKKIQISQRFTVADALLATILLIKKIIKLNYAYSFKNIMLLNSYYKFHQKQGLIMKLIKVSLDTQRGYLWLQNYIIATAYIAVKCTWNIMPSLLQHLHIWIRYLCIVVFWKWKKVVFWK